MDIITVANVKHQEELSMVIAKSFLEEPMVCIMNIDFGEMLYLTEQICQAVCRDLCLVAINGPEIIGGLIAFDACEKLAIEPIEKFIPIFSVLEEMEIISSDRKVNQLMLAVKKEYQGQGIASLLVAESNKVSREKEYDVVEAIATGRASQKIFSKLGYDLAREKEYCLFDFKGDNFFHDLNFSCKTFCKNLMP